MRLHLHLPIAEPTGRLASILPRLRDFEHIALLHSNPECYPSYPRHRYQAILAVGAAEVLTIPRAGNAFYSLQNRMQAIPDWWFGHLGYDLKNETETLSSSHPDGLSFPDAAFFRPEVVALFHCTGVEVWYLPGRITEKEIHTWFASPAISDYRSIFLKKPALRAPLDATEYAHRVQDIQRHIRRGDIYEMNFCMEFADPEANIIPDNAYLQLNENAPAPFSAFYRTGHRYMLGFSPERFMARRGNEVWSQPIKGTLGAIGADKSSDEAIRQWRQNAKEVAENVMITDLVRNDLSKLATSGSVDVEELCGVYRFSHVWQMISTIRCIVAPGVPSTEIIKGAFPMGSMTGAPKVKAMQLAELYELHRRGLYSGAFGYFAPDGDFDFNVVIRSLLYNHANRYLSYSAGSAITAASVAEAEYLECISKTYPVKDFIVHN